MFSSEYWFGASPSFYNGAVSNSLRVNGGHYLSNTFGTPTSTTTMSFGGWFKFSAVQYQNFFSQGLGGSGVRQAFMRIDSSFKLNVDSYDTGSSVYFQYITTRVFRDLNAWYHIWVQIDTTEVTDSNRVKIYVNGVRETAFDTQTHISTKDSAVVGWNTAVTHHIGYNSASFGLNGYIADFWFLDGQDVSPIDTVGEFKNGIFIPKEYSATFGNNGFHLKFNGTGTATSSGSVATPTNIGDDSSGQNNHWAITSGVATHDANLPDCPENSFCYLNPLDPYTGTIGNGNLSYTNGASYNACAGGMFIPSSGKWYFEVLNVLATTGSNAIWTGVAHPDTNLGGQPNNGSTTGFYGLYNDSTLGILNNGSQSSFSTNQITANQIIQVAVDVDNEKLYVGIDNSYYSNSSTTNGDPSGGNNPTQSSINLAGYKPFVGAYINIGLANFGQDGSFGGQLSGGAIGNSSDGNGNGKFKFTPPTGFLALCSANIPEPTIGPNSDTQVDDYFDILTYTGNSANDSSGSTQSITGLDFKPDWIWTKNRDTASDHRTVDSSRGEQKTLYLSDTYDENAGNDGTDGITSFIAASSSGAGGFAVGQHTGFNKDGDDFIAWCWKANGGTTSTISVGDVSSGVPSIASTVQVNTTAGFSIVTFTGNNTNDATIGHGLGTTPAMIITKNRDDHLVSGVYMHWRAWHKDLTANNVLYFSHSHGQLDSVSHSNGYIKTVGDDTYSTHAANVDSNAVNGASDDMVAYCFAEVEGYSKFGKYIGNGDPDGTFVYLGFRPAFFLHKRINDTENWHVIDTIRDPINKVGNILFPDITDVEAHYTSEQYDILSNGIKLRNDGASKNGSGDSYIYMAFAEAPFKYANAR